MLKLFHQNHIPTYGALSASRLRELNTRASYIVETLTDYFKRSALRLPNEHLMVQILRHLEFSTDTPFEKVVETVYARAPYIAKHFNLTSLISYGKGHKNVFYSSPNNDVVDFVFSNSVHDIDPFSDDLSWLEFSPFQVIHHPCTDSSLYPNWGANRSKWQGYSVVHVDIPLLALQYNKFMHEMLFLDPEFAFNPNKFLVTRALPKMYRSHIDYLLVNRFSVREGLIPEVESRSFLPIALPSFENLVKSNTEEVYKKLINKAWTYSQSLETIPSAFMQNGKESLKLPLVVATRNTNWFQFLSRMPVIEMLISIQGRKGRDANNPYLKQFLVEGTAFVNSREHNSIEPKAVRENLLSSINRILKLCNES